jgi:hypothetical protein
VGSEVGFALLVNLSARELAELVAIRTDLVDHCCPRAAERKALDGSLKALGIKRLH